MSKVREKMRKASSPGSERETNIFNKFKSLRQQGKDFSADSADSDINKKISESNTESNKKKKKPEEPVKDLSTVKDSYSDPDATQLSILEKFNQKKKEKALQENEEVEKDEVEAEEKTGRNKQALSKTLEDFTDVNSETFDSDVEFWEYYFIDALEIDLGFESITDGSLEEEVKYFIENCSSDKDSSSETAINALKNIVSRFEGLIEDLENSEFDKGVDQEDE